MKSNLSEDNNERFAQRLGTPGVGVALAFAFPSPVLSFVVEFMFEFEFVFVLLRPPLRPRRRGVGVAGGAGPASAGAVAGSAGVAGITVGSAGVAGVTMGSAGVAGVAGLAAAARLCRVRARAVPAGVNEQTWVAPGTVVSVRRSPDFFARIETIVGALPGCAAVPMVSSPNCIATPV
jgi:hypothetical protein